MISHPQPEPSADHPRPDASDGSDGPGATVIPLPVHRLRGGSRSAVRPTTRRPSAGPDPVTLAATLVRACAEVAAGRRALVQLEPVLAPTLLRRLAIELRSRATRPQELPTIRRVLMSAPTPSGALEATVLVELHGRVTAVALRLERHHGAWRATELTAPESGFAPLRTRSNPLGARGFDAFDEAAGDDQPEVTRRRGSA